MKLLNRVKKLENRRATSGVRYILVTGTVNKNKIWAEHLKAHPEDRERQPEFLNLGEDDLGEAGYVAFSDMSHEEAIDFLD